MKFSVQLPPCILVYLTKELGIDFNGTFWVDRRSQSTWPMLAHLHRCWIVYEILGSKDRVIQGLREKCLNIFMFSLRLKEISISMQHIEYYRKRITARGNQIWTLDFQIKMNKFNFFFVNEFLSHEHTKSYNQNTSSTARYLIVCSVLIELFFGLPSSPTKIVGKRSTSFPRQCLVRDVNNPCFIQEKERS